jgi:hypothetical protein
MREMSRESRWDDKMDTYTYLMCICDELESWQYEEYDFLSHRVCWDRQI